MGNILGAVLPVFALIAAGFVFARRFALGGDAVAVLNAFTVRLALPALLFGTLAAASLRQVWQPGFLAAYAAGMAVAWLGGVLLPPAATPLPARAIDGLSAGYANTAFMGIPLLAALHGANAALPAILASILTVVLLFVASCALIEIDLHRDRPAGEAWARIGLALARNPLVLAPAAGAAWSAAGLGYPAPLAHFTGLLGGAATPVALVTIGMSLAQPPPVGAAGGARLGAVVLLKLVVQPAVTAIAVGLVAMPRDWAGAAVLVAALPTGTGAFMVAQLYAREATLAARATLVSTLLSVVTIPALAYALG